MEWTEEDRELLCLRHYGKSYCGRVFSGETGKFYTVHQRSCDEVFKNVKTLVEDAEKRTE